MANSQIPTKCKSGGSSVVALCGGIGGAKLALGLYRVLDPNTLTVVINTGDDFEHLGLHISPDIDTVTYTLADKNNQETGWGRRDETWNFMDSLAELGGETWFALGDRDLAIHVERTRRLRADEGLGEITSDIAGKFGIDARLLPMSDDAAATIIQTAAGPLTFQDYFVRMKCKPIIQKVLYEQAQSAIPNAEAMAALRQSELRAIIVCPSNPFLSIDPILAVPGIRNAIRESPAPVIGISPIIGGEAIKGPTAKIMAELFIPSTARAIAEHYDGMLDGYVIDVADGGEANDMPIRALATRTLMKSIGDRENLARQAIAFADTLSVADHMAGPDERQDA